MTGPFYVGRAMAEAGIFSNRIDDQHLAETPQRVFKFWQEFVNPGVDLQGILKAGFLDEQHASTGGMVIQQDIPFRGLCAHHLLPFVGSCAVGYLPQHRVVGLSKIARLVDACGTQFPATQEIITNNIADVMSAGIEPLGVIVVTSATHMCMAARGIKVPTTTTKVSAIRGNFIHSQSARMEFFQVVNLP